VTTKQPATKPTDSSTSADPSSLTVEELQKQRYLLEGQILRDVRIAVDEFRQRTGRCPRAINIDMVSTTAIGDEYSTWEAIDVVVDVGLRRG